MCQRGEIIKNLYGGANLCYNVVMELLTTFGRGGLSAPKNIFKSLSRVQKLSLLAIISTIVYAFAQIPVFSEYVFARGITRFLNFVIGRITGFFAISFYEWTAVALIIICPTLLGVLIVRLVRKKYSRAVQLLYKVAMFILWIFLLFGILYAPLYNRKSVFSAFGLERVSLTEENIYTAAEYYVEKLNILSEEVERDEEGNVVSPYTFSELGCIINEEYAKYEEGFFAPFCVQPKQVILSVPMSYLGITGIYFPFYAEANVNVNIPSCDLPVTMAHEIAHGKGVSSESEANVSALVICLSSEDTYLQYCGLMSAVSDLLYALPEESSKSLREKLRPEVLNEYRNVSEHYKKYDGLIDSISSFFNDLFLKANGVEGGIVSYSQTTEGLVSLYLKEYEKQES